MPFEGAVFLRFFCKKNDALNGQLDFFVITYIGIFQSDAKLRYSGASVFATVQYLSSTINLEAIISRTPPNLSVETNSFATSLNKVEKPLDVLLITNCGSGTLKLNSGNFGRTPDKAAPEFLAQFVSHILLSSSQMLLLALSPTQ